MSTQRVDLITYPADASRLLDEAADSGHLNDEQEAALRSISQYVDAAHTALLAISTLHLIDSSDPNFCKTCGTSYPCLTRQAINQTVA